MSNRVKVNVFFIYIFHLLNYAIQTKMLILFISEFKNKLILCVMTRALQFNLLPTIINATLDGSILAEIENTVENGFEIALDPEFFAEGTTQARPVVTRAFNALSNIREMGEQFLAMGTQLETEMPSQDQAIFREGFMRAQAPVQNLIAAAPPSGQTATPMSTVNMTPMMQPAAPSTFVQPPAQQETPFNPIVPMAPPVSVSQNDDANSMTTPAVAAEGTNSSMSPSRSSSGSSSRSSTTSRSSTRRNASPNDFIPFLCELLSVLYYV